MHNKKAYIFAGVIIILTAGYFLYSQVIKPHLDNRTVEVVVPITIKSANSPLEFTYPSGAAAYALIEPPVQALTESGLEKVYLIMNNADYLKYDAEESEQAPPTVSVFIFKTPERSDEEVDAGRITRLQTWAQQNSQFSSFASISSETEIVKIDGVAALKYRTEGQYQQEVYLANYRQQTYVFTGQFETETDDIYRMYTELINSIIFN